jgi:hypothetical protein
MGSLETTGYADDLKPESAAKRLLGGRGVGMILHVGYAAVLHGQNLRPLMRISVAVGP